MKVRIYLCAMFSRQDEMRVISENLQLMGFEVTSRWLDENFANPLNKAESAAAAELDLYDITRSDLLVAFTQTPDVGYYTGGRHVELGYAIGRGLSVMIVGPRENVFCNLRRIEHFDSLGDWLERMKKLC